MPYNKPSCIYSPLRVQSSPGARGGSATETPTAPRPVTAAALPSQAPVSGEDRLSRGSYSLVKPLNFDGCLEKLLNLHFLALNYIIEFPKLSLKTIWSVNNQI